MMLKNALDLRKDIREHRNALYVLAKSKGLSHPEVIKISQQIDNEISLLQKIVRDLSTFKKV
ncbi:aspartyl-phosphate phosphatase Spo0E family protein [Neobacillus bataviensis]|uniref:aspartyl-phosphate phosphatase Spo0E family protein n=1 Tax=Neobacillus bataviensis TaxID=220685 RepID=UPI001CC1BC0F|nr:aspartyl-phosphate phosphatase Spo0E family protein [Neobacillus bataviensis]